MSGQEKNSKARTRSASRVENQTTTMNSPANNTDIMNALQEIVSRLNSIEKRIDSIDSKFESIDSKISSLENSLQYHSDTVDGLLSDVSALKSDMSVMKSMQDSLKDIDLETAGKCIEIQGLPSSHSENRLDIVKAIGNLVECPITNENIDYVYRNKRGNIVAKFIQTHKRNALLEKAKSKSKAQPIMAKDIGYRMSPNRIYVNEFLLYDTRELFYKVRLFQKQYNYKYSWTTNQKVFLREKEGSSALRINSLKDLFDIKPDYKP